MSGNFNNLKENLLAILTVICAFLAAVGVAFFITLNTCAAFLKVPTHLAGATRAQVWHDYWRMIRYVEFGGHRLTFDYLPMSASAQHHFADVHQLVAWGGGLTIVVVVLSLYLSYRTVRTYSVWRLYQPALLLACVLVIGVVMVTVDFNGAFLFFHEHVFSNQDWVFNAKKDPVIQVLTQSFFLKAFLEWAGITGLLMVIQWLLAKRSLVNLFAASPQAGLKTTDSGRNQGNDDDSDDD